MIVRLRGYIVPLTRRRPLTLVTLRFTKQKIPLGIVLTDYWRSVYASEMLDADEKLTHQEILSRFKRIFKRDMTPQEKKTFFLFFDAAENPDLQSDNDNAAK